MTDTSSVYPVLGQIATTTAAMRAAAGLIESTGIAGLSVTCEDEAITIQVGEHLGDPVARAALVARLATAVEAVPVRADAACGPLSWIRAEGAVAGLRVRVFTCVPVQQADGLPLACDGSGNIAQASDAAGQPLPAGWRWLTSLDPAARPATTQVV